MKHFYSPTQGYYVFDEAPIPLGDWVEVPARPAPGQVWNGDEWVSPPEPELTVPEFVTANAARKALNAAGLRQAVEDAVAGASQDVKDDWEYAPTIRRHSPTVMALSVALGLSEAQLDALFIKAVELST